MGVPNQCVARLVNQPQATQAEIEHTAGGLHHGVGNALPIVSQHEFSIQRVEGGQLLLRAPAFDNLGLQFPCPDPNLDPQDNSSHQQEEQQPTT